VLIIPNHVPATNFLWSVLVTWVTDYSGHMGNLASMGFSTLVDPPNLLIEKA
jgi:hypothetical protein